MSLDSFDGLQEKSERQLHPETQIQFEPDLPLAMYEAGRAFAYEYHGVRVKDFAHQKSIPTINGQRVLAGGVTEPAFAVQITKYSLWPEIVCIMAGAAAQHTVDAQGAMDSAAADVRHAAERMEPVGLDQKQTDEVIVEAAKAAVKIITKNIGTVRRIAEVLEKKKRIQGDEIREIMRQEKESARL
jgi:hypothetical protein